MMSLMVFTISAVSACRTQYRGVSCLEPHEREEMKLRLMYVSYLDFLCDSELFMVDVVHFHHQDVGGGQRLKLWAQVCI